MNKKKVAMILAILVIVFFLIVNSKYAMAKKIFGISMTNYDVVKVEKSLDPFSYNGKYLVVLELNEKQLESFCKEIKEKFGEGYNKSKYEKEYGEEAIKLPQKIIGSQITEDAVIYMRSIPKQRVVLNLFAGAPKTVNVWIVYMPVEEGKYQAWLSYAE